MPEFFSYLAIIFFSLLLALLLPVEYLIRPSYKKRYQYLFSHITELMRNPGKLNTNNAGLKAQNKLQYKNFYTLVQQILSLTKKHGGKCYSLLSTIRERMGEDFKFEKKQRDLLASSLFQFLFIAALSWSMSVGAATILERGLSIESCVVVALWQCLGIFCFCAFYLVCKRAYLHPLQKFYSVLYFLKVLLQAPIPLAELSKLSGIASLNHIKDGELQWFIQRLHQAVEASRKMGRGLADEVEFLSKELVYVERLRMDKVERLLNVSKLLVIMVFFVVSYFFLMIQMVSQVLSQAW